MINVVHKKWRLEANVTKCAVVVFRNEKTFEWFWGNSALPNLDYYNYLGVKFTYNGHWDAHIKDLVTAVKHKVNSLLRMRTILIILKIVICKSN